MSSVLPKRLFAACLLEEYDDPKSLGSCAYSVILSSAKFPRKDVLPTESALSLIALRSKSVGSSPVVSMCSCISFSLYSLDVCIASNEASPADEYAAIAVLLAASLKPANLFVAFARSPSFDVLVAKSATDDISFFNIAAASTFLPTLKALAVFLNKGENILNPCAASAAVAPAIAALPRAAPALNKPALAILPLTIAPTANPLFLINLSNRKFALNQLSGEYHDEFFSASV